MILNPPALVLGFIPLTIFLILENNKQKRTWKLDRMKILKSIDTLRPEGRLSLNSDESESQHIAQRGKSMQKATDHVVESERQSVASDIFYESHDTESQVYLQNSRLEENTPIPVH
eukprot:CAMPEP_0114984608 /NCGR_PEP_ID=MMETSP0216-20121206/7371_1 /TAXON_ID=223996 /ORGANISM="Protocruzia adherens, Strain Boccale" /LENGTH=115 /DNA_ID=CAMNT_0002346763 /DNA_START=958 /DNA_END=1305 /DNA_ORIENTATION=-